MRNLLTAVAVLLAVLLGACSTLPLRTEAPRVTLIGLELESVDMFEQRYLARLRVKNPNAFVLKIRGVDVRLDIEGKLLADGVSASQLDVPAYGEDVLELALTSNLLRVFRQLRSLDLERDLVSYRLSGELAIGEAARRLPFAFSGDIEWPEAPRRPSPSDT